MCRVISTEIQALTRYVGSRGAFEVTLQCFVFDWFSIWQQWLQFRLRGDRGYAGLLALTLFLGNAKIYWRGRWTRLCLSIFKNHDYVNSSTDVLDRTSVELLSRSPSTVYPKKYAHGFCFAVLSCGYTLIDFPISIRLTSLALWQSNDCPRASKATLMNMDK